MHNMNLLSNAFSMLCVSERIESLKSDMLSEDWNVGNSRNIDSLDKPVWD